MAKEMNEIEKIFYDAFSSYEPGDYGILYEIQAQVPVGIYKLDFIYGNCAIEIDGHEWHKTKEQREHDYKRERILLKQGLTIIRFTASEVFKDPVACVRDVVEIGQQIEDRKFNIYHKAWNDGKTYLAKKQSEQKFQV